MRKKDLKRSISFLTQPTNQPNIQLSEPPSSTPGPKKTSTAPSAYGWSACALNICRGPSSPSTFSTQAPPLPASRSLASPPHMRTSFLPEYIPLLAAGSSSRPRAGLETCSQGLGEEERGVRLPPLHIQLIDHLPVPPVLPKRQVTVSSRLSLMAGEIEVRVGDLVAINAITVKCCSLKLF